MSMKLLQTFTEGNQTAKLYKDSEWQEYRVKFFIDGKHLLDADYHTDDRRDAQGTALEQLRRGLTLTRTNPAPKSPRRVSQITGKPPSKRLKARRAKKHVPGYFPNPRKSQSVGLGNPRHSARTPQHFYWFKVDGSVSRAFVTKRAAESQARIYAKNSGKTVALIRGTQREYLDIVAPESRAARYDA